MKIILNENEILNVEEQILFSQEEIRKHHRKAVYGASNNPKKAVELNREGCFYEAAVCKFQNIPYKHQLFGIDAGEYEVRGTKYPTGRLILHPKDNNNHIFILVTGKIPTFELVGWIKGIDGKKNEFWTDPSNTNRYAYFIPQNKLNSINELIKEGGG